MSYLVGVRDAGYAHEFMQDVADWVDSHIQLTTDGYKLYLDAVEGAFGGQADYAQLVEICGAIFENAKCIPIFELFPRAKG